MTRWLRILVAAGAAIGALPLEAQEVTGLLSRGHTIAFPDALLPSVTPIATAAFRLAANSGDSERVAWSVGALRDELDRVGTRASLAAAAGLFVVHATFERAALRNLEEISDFERTGNQIAAHDGRVEAGVLSPITRQVWAGISVRYAESLLANHKTGAGELLISAGWRDAHGFESVIEAGAVSFASPSDSDADRNSYGRMAIRTPALLRGLSLVAGATLIDLRAPGQQPLSGAIALRWSGWRQKIVALGGSEWGPKGLTDSAFELQLTGGRITLGSRVARQAPGTNGIQIWVGSGR